MGNSNHRYQFKSKKKTYTMKNSFQVHTVLEAGGGGGGGGGGCLGSNLVFSSLFCFTAAKRRDSTFGYV